MAVNLTDKIHVVRDDIPTKNLGSSLSNSGRDSVSVQEIVDLVPSGPTIEQGTFTPTLGLIGTGGITAISYNQQDGWYTKIGDQVTVGYKIWVQSWTTAGSGVLVPYFTLPFVPYESGSSVPGGIKTVLAHTVGAQNGFVKQDVRGGVQSSVNNTFATWAFMPPSGTPAQLEAIDTGDIVAYIGGFFIEGIINYKVQQ